MAHSIINVSEICDNDEQSLQLLNNAFLASEQSLLAIESDTGGTPSSSDTTEADDQAQSNDDVLCPKCDKLFKKQHFETHFVTHEIATIENSDTVEYIAKRLKRLFCVVCDKVFLSAVYKRFHEKTKIHLRKAAQATAINKNAERKPIVKEVCRKLRKVSCDVCGTIFDQRAHLLRHKKVAGIIDKNNNEDEPRQKGRPLFCHMCNQVFCTERLLQIHRKRSKLHLWHVEHASKGNQTKRVHFKNDVTVRLV